MIKKAFRSHRIAGAIAITLGLSGLSGCGQKTSEEHMVAAKQYLEANDVNAAIVEYKNAIKQDPKSASARFELGKVYLEQKKFDEAEKELNRAIELGAKSAEVMPFLTIAYQKTGAETALAAVDHNLEGLSAPERAKVGFYKLQALMKLDKKTEARQLIDELKGLDTRSVYKGMILVFEELLNSQPESALASLQELRKQAPLNQDLLSLLARLHLMMRQPDAAIAVYQDYVRAYPNDTETKFVLTAMLMEQRRIADAEPMVDDLLKINSKQPLLNQFKGIIMAAKNKPEDALAYLETAIQNGRNDPIARLVAGHSAYRIEDYNAAIRHLSMVASSLPGNHAGLRMLADSLLQTGENEAASEILTRIDGDYDSDAALFSKAGFQLLQEGNVVDAQQMIEKSEALATTPEDLARLGVLQLSLNDVEGLINLEEAVKQAPELSSTQKTLASAYIVSKQLDKARDAIDQWLAEEPKSLEALLMSSQVALEQNQFKKARSEAQQALALYPDNVKARLQDINVDLRDKKGTSALEKTKALLKLEPTNQAALSVYYALMKQGDKPTEARDYIQQVVEQYPDALSARIVLARIALDQQDYAMGIDALESVPVEKSVPQGVWELKGFLYLRSGNLQKADDVFDSWIAMAPNNKTAVVNKLLVLDAQSRFAKAIELINKFEQKHPDKQISILKAYFLSLTKSIPEAWSIIDSLSPKEQSLPFVRGVKARLEIYQNKPEQALPNALAAYEENPTSRNMLLVVAAYEMSEEQSKGLMFLQSFVEQNPNDVQGNMLLAERLISQDPAAAKKMYIKVLEATPDNFVVLNNVAYLEMLDNNLDDAESYARKAVSLQPRSAEAADTLAQVLIMQGELEDAKTLYEKVVTPQTRSEDVYLNYIELLYKLDLDRLAQRRLNDKEFTTAEAKQRITELQKTYN